MTEDVLHEETSMIGPLRCSSVRLVLDDGSRIVSVADEYDAMMGYSDSASASDPFHRKIRNLVFEDDLARFDAEMKEVIEGIRLCLRYRIRKENGSLAWHLAYATAVVSTDSGIVGDFVIFDITAEDNEVAHMSKAGKSDVLFTEAMPHMLNVIVTEHDFETQILAIPEQEGLGNLGRKRISPMSHDEFIASGLIHADSLAAYTAFLKQLETEDRADVAVRYCVAADTYHWVHLDAYVVKRENGRACRRIGLIRFTDEPPAGLSPQEGGSDNSSSVIETGTSSGADIKEEKMSKPRKSSRSGLPRLRKPILLLILVFAVTCLSIAGIFLNYSNTLRHEFYQMSIESMNDYTVAQKIEVEGSIHEIENTIAAMVVLAETPDIDPAGEAFSSYIAGWNEKQSFQIDYVTLAQLQAALSSSNALPSDKEMLERIQRGENIISEVRYSDRLQGYYYSVAEPIKKQGSVVGALRSIVVATDLLKTSQDSSQVSLASASLIKRDGTLLLTGEGTSSSQRSFYDILREMGMPDETVLSAREAVENDSTVSTMMLGERDSHMFFLTAIRLNYNDWNIVNITEESRLAEHSDAVLHNTFATGLVLVGISIGAALLVFFFFSRMSRKISYETDRYNILSEFTDTVLFEYSYKTDTLTLTPNARKIFFVTELSKERYLKEDVSLVTVHPDDYHLVKDLLEHPATSGEMREIIYRAQVLSGDYRWFSCQCRYVYEGLEVCTAVGKIVDIDEQKAYENRLVEQAQLDGLTNIYNKGAAELRIDTALAQGNPGFLFMMDVNDFKSINDEYGHAMGDRVLARVGRALTTVFRQTDSVGRTGGDEFIAYLFDTDNRAIAEEKARLVSEYMDKVSFELAVPISLSIGIAQFPAEGTTYKELFKTADARMYEKKNHMKKRSASSGEGGFGVRA